MGWKINGVPHTGQILTVGPSGRDFTSPRAAYNAASVGALILVEPGLYPALSIDHSEYIYGWTSKNVYWRGLGDSPSDTVFTEGSLYAERMMFAKDMVFENIKFVPKGYSLVVIQHPITSGLIFNKCAIVNAASGKMNYSVEGWFNNDYSQIIDGGIKFINVEFPDTYLGVFRGASPSYPLQLNKIYVSKCIISDNDYDGNYLTGTFALADWVQYPTIGYGCNYGDFLITEGEGGGGIAAKEQHYRRLRNG